MSAYTEKRRLASNTGNFEKRRRGSRTADDGKHVVVDDLTNLLDAQEGRYANVLEPRAPVGVRQDFRQPILRRARNLRTRNLDDDVAMTDAELEAARKSGASPSPDVHRASAFSAANSKVGSQRGLLNLGTAAIVVIGVAGGLAASWGEVFGFRQTIAVENANDDHGAAIELGTVPTPPTQASGDSQFSDPATTASLPAPAADSAAPAAIPKDTPDAQTAQKSGTAAESRDLGYPASAMGEATQRLTSAFDGAPPVDHGSSPQHQKDELVDKEINPSGQRNSGACYVKVDGRVYVNGPCQIFRSKGQSLTLGLTDKTVTLAFDHGRTWTATMGKRQLGKVFKRDSMLGEQTNLHLRARYLGREDRRFR